MDLYKKVSMKDMLAHSLYLLMKEKHFDKITIKEITSKTGVIRGTFYNHFYDKYEALEYLTHLIIFNHQNNQGINDYDQLLGTILLSIEEEKEYFKHCFTIEGQNGFEQIITHVFNELLEAYLNEHHIQFKQSLMKKEIFIGLNVNIIVFVIKKWMNEYHEYSSTQIYELLHVIFTQSTQEMMNKEK